MGDSPLPTHFEELREGPSPVVAPATSARLPRYQTVVREELVVRRRRVGARAPQGELGRGEVRVTVVRDQGRTLGAAP
ncbi:MAG: hypothetical protein M3010_05135 [Candidatus Dormibacteraeota bacterium]|nr:hypothetical protein [Candidatus Dormibacteraeota bacterium]